MNRILVAGGDGNLGSRIVRELETQQQTVRVMSRKAEPQNLSGTLEWARVDVTTGAGIDAALQDVDIIVNV